MTTPRSLRPRSRPVAGAVALLLVVAGLTSCLSTPADTSGITAAGSTTVDGWTYDFYRNLAEPCSISGYQTFAIGTKDGSSPTEARPLWAKLHGGGAGWFAPDGTPQPTAGSKSEESLDTLLKYDTPGLMASVKAAPEGFRVLLVSMCSQDIYAGADTPDPNNPNLTPDGKPRPTTGLVATKAAIQFTMAKYPTTRYFLHGTSAGGAGALEVGYALQLQGIPPAGIISDSGVLNQAWETYVADNGISGSPGCEKATTDRGVGVLGRIYPGLADPANQPDQLVARGELTVPIVHVWNHGDQNSCGEVPIDCPLPDGTTVTMGAADCRHEPLKEAIDAEGPQSTSENIAVCVEGQDTTTPCDQHVVTTRKHPVNTDPNSPSDYQAAILDWVRARLADA